MALTSEGGGGASMRSKFQTPSIDKRTHSLLVCTWAASAAAAPLQMMCLETPEFQVWPGFQQTSSTLPAHSFFFQTLFFSAAPFQDGGHTGK